VARGDSVLSRTARAGADASLGITFTDTRTGTDAGDRVADNGSVVEQDYSEQADEDEQNDELNTGKTDLEHRSLLSFASELDKLPVVCPASIIATSKPAQETVQNRQQFVNAENHFKEELADMGGLSEHGDEPGNAQFVRAINASADASTLSINHEPGFHLFHRPISQQLETARMMAYI
jgi:hypothetical protein